MLSAFLTGIPTKGPNHSSFSVGILVEKIVCHLDTLDIEELAKVFILTKKKGEKICSKYLRS